MNLLLTIDSKTWTFIFLQMCQRIQTFLKKKKDDSRNWFSEKFQSKYWTFLMTRFFVEKKKTWLTELNPCFSNMTHWNWTFLFNMTLTHIWLKDLNLFLSMSQRIELCSWQELNFFENDSKILLNRTQRIELFFFWRWPKEPNFF